MTSDAEKALGGFVRLHKTDNGRRGSTALVALVVGLVAAAIAVPLMISAFSQSDGVGRGLFPGLVLGVALACLWSGISNGLSYLNTSDERFKVREGGLVHQRTGKTRVVRWGDIAKVVESGQENAFSRALGWNVHCRIKIKGGDRLLVTGFTEDAGHLSQTLRQAVHQGIRPSPQQPPSDSRARG